MANQEKPGRDALEVLRAEHARIKSLFRDFDNLPADDDDDDQRKAELVDDICYELAVHAMIEEEIFYPAVRAGAGQQELMDEADIEHAGARELISQLEIMYPGDDHFDAIVTVLGEEMAHHMDKEESAMFAAARAAGIDLQILGSQLAARRMALDEDLTAPPATMDPIDPRDGTRGPPRPPN
ncbi:hemerythrin domain-containing protein [Massilia sp. PAMC28688]|uniref:hemerythrin domain-containing protein n=1 Tax=Massilia sp. PAMC28688 TaxID=2861283 RepID=UPI001C62D51B|nr:hemerythrin domain-containing protein [Massilia sp. PAMC28688]QYF93764.1 hemerythrin domain-containing protein [Massilia sp. PAMC28688]